MSISPMGVGDTYPPWYPTVMQGNAPLNFQTAGINAGMLSLLFRNQERPFQEHTGTGSFAIFDPTNGVIEYVFTSADTAIAGTFDVFLTINWPSSGSPAAGGPQTYGPFVLVIQPK